MTDESKALATQEVIEDAEVVEEQEKKPRAGFGKLLWPVFLLIIIFGAMGALGYYGYQYYLSQKAVLQAQAEKLASLESAIAANDPSSALNGMNARLDRQDSAIAEQRGLNARVDALQESVQASHDLVNRAQRDWVVAEVEYLIRIANQRLRLMRDYNGSIAALEAADQRLHELADPALIPVREILADDIRTLKDFEKPDLIGIALRLDRLISHLKPLPLNVPALEQEPQSSESEAQAEESRDFAGMMSEAWRRLNERVTVRHYEEGVESLPDEESELMMNQLLRLRLEAARVDVLRQDDHDFHQQLGSALEILDKYYRPEQAAKLREEIVALNAINLRPALPDITRSLGRLHQQAVVKDAAQ
jgi:uroporphyrin-3 C-methyltransferase